MPRLESSYFRTEALGATSICTAVNRSGDYKWTPEGKCLQISTGQIYPGKQSESNCTCLGPPPKAPSGWSAVATFAKDLLAPRIAPGPGRPAPAPDPSFTASGLVLPAVLVVGGVGLLLVLSRKKK